MYIDLNDQRERVIHRYRLVVEKSRRHWQAVNEPPSYKMYDPNEAVDYRQHIRREPLNKIYVADKDLEFLIQDLTRLDLLKEENFELKTIQVNQAREQKLRETTPALKKAWENYQTLLRLSQ
jgi:BMFP domain-containing protein YqiC